MGINGKTLKYPLAVRAAKGFSLQEWVTRDVSIALAGPRRRTWFQARAEAAPGAITSNVLL